MSDVETILTRAHSLSAKACGGMALAIAKRRLAPGSLAAWADALRHAAAALEALRERRAASLSSESDERTLTE